MEKTRTIEGKTYIQFPVKDCYCTGCAGSNNLCLCKLLQDQDKDPCTLQNAKIWITKKEGDEKTKLTQIQEMRIKNAVSVAMSEAFDTIFDAGEKTDLQIAVDAAITGATENIMNAFYVKGD